MNDEEKRWHADELYICFKCGPKPCIKDRYYMMSCDEPNWIKYRREDGRMKISLTTDEADSMKEGEVELIRSIGGVSEGYSFRRIEGKYAIFDDPDTYGPESIGVRIELPYWVGGEVALCEDAFRHPDGSVCYWVDHAADIMDRAKYGTILAYEMDPKDARWLMNVTKIRPELVGGQWVVHYSGPVRRRD